MSERVTRRLYRLGGPTTFSLPYWDTIPHWTVRERRSLRSILLDADFEEQQGFEFAASDSWSSTPPNAAGGATTARDSFRTAAEQLTPSRPDRAAHRPP